jgi:hypothetical protein
VRLSHAAQYKHRIPRETQAFFVRDARRLLSVARKRRRVSDVAVTASGAGHEGATRAARGGPSSQTGEEE